MLCDKKHSHVQWRDFKMNVLVCDDDQQIVDSIIEDTQKEKRGNACIIKILWSFAAKSNRLFSSL